MRGPEAVVRVVRHSIITAQANTVEYGNELAQPKVRAVVQAPIITTHTCMDPPSSGQGHPVDRAAAAQGWWDTLRRWGHPPGPATPTRTHRDRPARPTQKRPLGPLFQQSKNNLMQAQSSYATTGLFDSQTPVSTSMLSVLALLVSSASCHGQTTTSLIVAAAENNKSYSQRRRVPVPSHRHGLL